MALIPFNQQDKRNYWPVTNLLEDFFGDPWQPMRNLINDTFKLDVREEILHYTVEAEMPGVPKEDISIEFQNGRLTIRVDRNEESDAQEEAQYIHRERSCTCVQRSVYLAGATGSGITAALTDGVLRITVPKEAETEKKAKIEVK